jgi:hypothetical protein
MFLRKQLKKKDALASQKAIILSARSHRPIALLRAWLTIWAVAQIYVILLWLSFIFSQFYIFTYGQNKNLYVCDSKKRNRFIYWFYSVVGSNRWQGVTLRAHALLLRSILAGYVGLNMSTFILISDTRAKYISECPCASLLKWSPAKCRNSIWPTAPASHPFGYIEPRFRACVYSESIYISIFD